MKVGDMVRFRKSEASWITNTRQGVFEILEIEDGDLAYLNCGPANVHREGWLISRLEPAIPVKAAPAASQHPADLKPRGVKAPMYLIPWEVVPNCSKHPALGMLNPGGPLTIVALSAMLSKLLDGKTIRLADVARVFEYGAKKYARDNWRTFVWDDSARDEYFGAVCRHLDEALTGHETDPESGCLHEAHAATGILIMLWHMTGGSLARGTFRETRADV